MRPEFKINNEIQKGAAFTVRLADLSNADRVALFPPIEPRTPDEWATRALLGLAERDIDVTKRALDKCPGHVLAEPLNGVLARIESELLAAKAKREFEGLRKRLDDVADRQQAARLLDELAAFERQFAETILSADYGAPIKDTSYAAPAA
jgi:hypothetical protein